MPPEKVPAPPQDNSAAEALIVSHETHAKTAETQRDALIQQHERHSPVPGLEAGIVQREKMNTSINENGSKIADAIKALSPEVQKMHSIMELAQGFMAQIKGDTGDQGIQGEKGEKGDTGEVGPIGPQGEKGDTGAMGDKGIRGERGPIGPQGLQGDMGERGGVGPRGAEGKPGKQGSPDTHEDIIKKVKGKLSYDDLKDRPNLDTLRFPTGKDDARIFDEGTLIEANLRSMNFTGSGVTSTSDGHGNITVVITGSSVPTIYNETPGGAVDGSNTAYTTAHTITSIFSFAINGQFIHPSDYSLSGSTITFGTPLDASLTGLPYTIIYA